MNLRQIYSPLLFALGGVIICVTEFLPWGMDISPFALYQISLNSPSVLVLLFPLISGLILLGDVVFLFSSRTAFRILFIIMLFFALGFDFIFISNMLNLNGAYLWKYSGIYVLIGGIIEIFIVFLLKFSSPMQKSEDLEMVP